MFANQDSWEDVKKYYGNTYVKFPDLTGDHLWYVEHVSPDKILVTDSNGEEAGIDLLVGYEITYVIPGRATFQYGPNAVQLSRQPARQWKKGMCKANTSFFALGMAGWGTQEFNIKIIEGFINKPSYYTIDLALKGFEKGELVSAALSPRVSVRKDGKVYIDKVLVARISLDKKEILFRKLFKPELEPLFPGFKTKVLA